jgi:hypothetical protein
MQRRSFFQRAFSGIWAFFTSGRARAQGVQLEAFHELASVVLPSALGRASTDKIADDFVQWFGNYKPGAEISSGYGHPRTQVMGPNPSVSYADQIRALGSSVTRETIEKALENAKIDRIPQRPNGKHVAADLLAYFYGSSAGEDFLYNAAIKRDDCRGLDTSGKRPASLA